MLYTSSYTAREGTVVRATDCAIYLLIRVVRVTDCAIHLLICVVRVTDCAIYLLIHCKGRDCSKGY